MTTSVSPSAGLALPANLYTAASGSTAGKTASASEQNDRFLKLLTTQLTNQDPLNPMDNAQMTSQVAQISTVSGIEQLNSAVKTLGSQFLQLQALQGASLVGRDVVVAGDQLAIADGRAQGGFELAAAASQVKVEVLNSADQVLKSVDLGPQAAGSGSFDISASGLDTNQALRFRVSAQSGATPVAASTLMQDRVNAVSTAGGGLTLELQRSGSVAYDSVKSVH